MYLYRAVDSAGKTLEFWVSTMRDAAAAKQFLVRALGAAHTVVPRVITVDKNPASPKALSTLKAAAGTVPPERTLRQVKELTHLVEQDQRCIKRLAKPGLGCFSFETAW
jgi:transposase, IS6 family